MARANKPTWTPSAADYEKTLTEQNPWHANGEVPVEWAREVERPLAQGLWSLLECDSPHRFHLVLGPRRVGKTTAMYQTVRHLLARGVARQRVWWYRLDHPLYMSGRLDELVRRATRTATPAARRTCSWTN